MEKEDIDKIKTAYEIIKTIGTQQNIDMFTKNGEAHIKELVSKNEKELNIIHIVNKHMDRKFNDWKEEIRDMIFERDAKQFIDKNIPENIQRAMLESFKEFQKNELKSIEKHVDNVKNNSTSNVEKPKYTWKRTEDTEEITKLVCSNGHSITITKSPDGQLVGRIDNKPGNIIKQEEIVNLKRQAEKLETIE